MIAKTTKKQYSQLREYIVSHHEYETACIVSIKIDDGDKKFLEWVEECTS